MEAEAPLLFHTAFTVVILGAVIYILYKRKRTEQKKVLDQFLWFLLLQIPTYGLLFFSLKQAAHSGDRTFTFGLAGVFWAISILNLVGGIQLMLNQDNKK